MTYLIFFSIFTLICLSFSTCDLYDNLSCEFEWSKYSCAHQGQLEKAGKSMEYAVKNSVFNIAEYIKYGRLSDRRLIIVGDSLIRQIFISIACQTANSTKKKAIKWIEWPCHGTVHCIHNGVHGGFNVASITYKEGGEVHFIPLGGRCVHSFQ